MAEGSLNRPMGKTKEEITKRFGPTNIMEAKTYENKLDNIFENFKKLLREDDINALRSTISEAKQHMTKQFSSMAGSDINIVMACIKDHTCSYLRSVDHQEGATVVDPDDDIPSGPELLKQLPTDKRYTKEIKDSVTSIFNHIANAHSEASLAAANIAALAKMADAETLDTVLRAAVRPLVQINWPERYLSLTADPKPTSPEEERKKKIIANLLPNSEAIQIRNEPKNNPTRLLAVVTYFKLRRLFLGEGTMRETEERFQVHSKQLSKLLSGKRYLGGKDKKIAPKRRRKSLSSSTAVKGPDDASSD